MAGKLTQNEAVNHRIALVVADVIVKIVCNEVSVPQAVQRVNEFADALKGTVPDNEVSDARAFMTDYVFSAQASMQKRERAENGKSSHKPFSEMTLDELANLAVEQRKNGGQTDPALQREYMRKRPPAKIRWLSDPRAIGLSKGNFNPDDVPWQKRQPWATIKTHLPPRHDRHGRKGKKSRMANWFPLGLRRRKGSGGGNTRIRIGWRRRTHCSLRVGLWTNKTQLGRTPQRLLFKALHRGTANQHRYLAAFRGRCYARLVEGRPCTTESYSMPTEEKSHD